MKRLFCAIIAIILFLPSCSVLDSIDVYPKSEKSQYSHKRSDVCYVVNKSSMTIHSPSCYMAEKIKEENKWEYDDLDFLIQRGYTPCKKCLDK